jgi:hypothetical protein
MTSSQSVRLHPDDEGLLSKPMSTNTDLEYWADKYKIRLNAVVSKDMLKNLTPRSGGYIVNLDDSTGGGTHWVCLWLEKKGKPSAYFDSFGIAPPIAIMNFARRHKSRLIYSEKKIQHLNGGYCGQYCLLFLRWMNRVKPPQLYDKYINFLRIFKE